MNVFLIAALTADGFIARDVAQVSTSWTSKHDKQWFNRRTKQAGVVVMGQKTFQTVGRPLPQRLNIVYSRSTPAIPIPEASDTPPSDIYYTALSPKELIADLRKKNYSEVAICGGSSIYSLFMKSGVVNKVYITIEPILFGQGVPLFGESLTASLKLMQTYHLSDQTLVLEYDVVG